jgi:two-component system, cell cycle response regulator
MKLFYLHAPDEIRHPYETALARLGPSVTWFENLADLAAQAEAKPQIVVVDFDAISKPWEPGIEQIRTAFPKSQIIALSSQDSAQIALRCLRSGFADFLLKPLSPEELAWSVRKAQQHLEIARKIEDPHSELMRVIGQISGHTTPRLVRLTALEFLKRLFRAKHAVCYSLESHEILAAIPKKTTQESIKKLLPSTIKGKRVLLRGKKSGQWKLSFPGFEKTEGVLFWGMKDRPKANDLSVGSILLEHGQLSLLNIQKFEEVKQQTYRDDVTGLYNSRYLRYAIDNAILRAKTPQQGFTVLFIDVDHFKSINDEHGHLVGSEFLVAIAKTIRNTIRNIDPVFRYGGDEFIVILQKTLSEKAWEIAERLRELIEQRTFVVKGKRLKTSVSIGLASFPEHATDYEQILHLADQALYDAKRASRNTVRLASGIEHKPKKIRQA